MSGERTPLDQAMTERSLHVKKRWVDIAREAGITTSALSGIRRGEYKPSAHTARALEDALHWEHGSIEAILTGGKPKTLSLTSPGTPEREPTLAEIVAKMNQLASEVKELQRRDAEREEREAERIQREGERMRDESAS